MTAVKFWVCVYVCVYGYMNSVKTIDLKGLSRRVQCIQYRSQLEPF